MGPEFAPSNLLFFPMSFAESGRGMIRRVSRPLSAKDIGKKSKFDGANSGCKKKNFLMQFLIFFCYELIVCPLIFKSNKVYFASSLIAKPNFDAESTKYFDFKERW